MLFVGQASEVVKWFEEMKQNGIEPDTAIYTELVTLYTKQGNIKEMMKWYSMLVQSNQQPNGESLC
jgi:pentatricopeptide repeat protein